MPVGPSYDVGASAEAVDRAPRRWRQAGDRHGARVRDVGQQRAERHDELRAQRLGQLDDQRARTSRQRIDGSGPETSTRSRGARGARAAYISTSGHSISRVRPSTSWTFGPRGLEVEELLRVEAGEAGRPQRGAEELHRGGGRVAGVVPAGERADQGRGAQAVGTAVPDERLHRITVHNAPCGRFGPVTGIATVRAGDELAGVFACTRKDRLLTRSGTPYLALELRDRTGTLPARVFRDADVLAGRFDRGDLVRVAGRVERFRDELQARAARDRARRPRRGRPGRVPARRLPRPRRARRLPRAPGGRGARPGLPGAARRRCSATPPCARRCAARRARAAATTPTSAACSSTRSPWPRSRSSCAPCTRGSTRTCCSTAARRPRPRHVRAFTLRRRDHAHRGGPAARPRRARAADARGARRARPASTTAATWRWPTAS